MTKFHSNQNVDLILHKDRITVGNIILSLIMLNKTLSLSISFYFESSKVLVSTVIQYHHNCNLCHNTYTNTAGLDGIMVNGLKFYQINQPQITVSYLM